MLPALNSIATDALNRTQKTLEATTYILDYATSNPNAKKI